MSTRHAANLDRLQHLRTMAAAASTRPWTGSGEDDGWWEIHSAGGYTEPSVLTMGDVSCTNYCLGGSSRITIESADRTFTLAAVNSFSQSLEIVAEAVIHLDRHGFCEHDHAAWECPTYRMAEAFLDAALGTQPGGEVEQ